MRKQCFRGWFTLLALGIAIWLCACSGSSREQVVDEKDLMPSYADVLKRWTTEAKVYQDFEAMLLAAGTLKSIDYRRAYVRQYARDYSLNLEESEKMLADQLAAGRSELEFLLSVSGPRPEEIDLDTKDSPWRVYLEHKDFGRMIPFEIRRVKKRTPALEGYYPYIVPWATTYQIRFKPVDRPPQTGELALVLAGVRGNARLVYKLEDQPGGP
ncbi:MAG: hypothetical protein HQK55_10290 [Deltaproteobacteria bacterium]|nr:hypothetical protein [Deltaproteobacteria bacterium]